MNFFIKGHTHEYDVISAIQSFYPNEKYSLLKYINTNETFIASIVTDNKQEARFYENGKLTDSYKTSEDKTSLGVKKSIYFLLSKKLNTKLPWGILVGIRPTKIIGILLKKGLSFEEVFLYMKDNYLVDDEKINLCIDVYKKENKIIKNNNGKDIALYIGIPFCPTKCLYCSFTSYSISKYKSFIEEYLSALEKEMQSAKRYLESNNKFLESIYIGGGTPTSLSDENLNKLLTNIHKHFDLSRLKEFTVEAGRPDTITKEKLLILKKHNVTRISINPQTMNDNTLKKIGRNHTVKEFLDSYYLAKELGFDNINIDLILGLPDETEKDILHTLSEIKKLKPSNITVHSLAIKKASRLNENLSKYILPTQTEMEKFFTILKSFTKEMNLKPYYLYRQKNIAGNFENIGFSKEGFECIYNVQIIEEKQDIFAIGAGATSKFVDLELNKIERVFNLKNINEYLSRIDEMIDRKNKFFKED